MDLFQALLPSGRGIRVRLLTPSQYDKAMVNASLVVGADAPPVAFRLALARENTKAFLHTITKAKVSSVEELAKVAPEQWVPLTSEKLEMPGEYEYDTLFSAKDSNFLTALFAQFHELTKLEAEAIVGKVLPVSVA